MTSKVVAFLAGALLLAGVARASGPAAGPPAAGPGTPGVPSGTASTVGGNTGGTNASEIGSEKLDRTTAGQAGIRGKRGDTGLPWDRERPTDPTVATGPENMKPSAGSYGSGASSDENPSSAHGQ